MRFKVGDRCKVVNSIHMVLIGQIVTIYKVDTYYHAICQVPYPFLASELELFPLTKLEQALK